MEIAINVVKPTRANWKAFRKRDVRYDMLKEAIC